MRQASPILVLATLLSAGVPAFADTAPTPADAAVADNAAQVRALDARLHDLQELMNEIELQAEQTKASLDKARPQPISLGSGQLLLQEALYGPNFETASGAQLVLGFNLNPLPGVSGSADLEFLGAVAPDRTLPQQEIDQLYKKNNRVLLMKTEVSFDGDWVTARAFRMVPRPDLYEEGDMFYLFPAVDDTNKYFRQSGRAVPSGAELKFKDGWLKGLDLWGGDELIYGVTNPTGFARYKNRLGALDFAVMARWIQDPSLGSGAITQQNQEAWIRVPVLKTGFSLDVAAQRSPDNVGKSYTTVDLGGGGASVNTVTTTEADAWGAQVRLRGIGAIPFTDEVSLSAQYGGALAGNVESVGLLLSFRPQRYTLLSLEGGWQKPLVGVNPTVHYGTPGLDLGVVPGTGPRPYGSVVTVSEDPISGANNREMQQGTLTLEFNPGKGWFYKWRPRIVDAWNFNTDLDTPFSDAFSAHAYNQPTGSDLGSYIDASGNRVGEGANATGLYPTNGWLYNLSNILAFRAWQTQWWLVTSYGDQLMGLSPDPAKNNAFASEYLNADLSVRWTRWLLSGGYGENLYGPDDWYRTFGLVIGAQTRASLTYSAGASKVSVNYVAWRDKDPAKFHFTGAPVNTATPFTPAAPLDQVMVSWALGF